MTFLWHGDMGPVLARTCKLVRTTCVLCPQAGLPSASSSGAPSPTGQQQPQPPTSPVAAGGPPSGRVSLSGMAAVSASVSGAPSSGAPGLPILRSPSGRFSMLNGAPSLEGEASFSSRNARVSLSGGSGILANGPASFTENGGAGTGVGNGAAGSPADGGVAAAGAVASGPGGLAGGIRSTTPTRRVKALSNGGAPTAGAAAGAPPATSKGGWSVQRLLGGRGKAAAATAAGAEGAGGVKRGVKASLLGPASDELVQRAQSWAGPSPAGLQQRPQPLPHARSHGPGSPLVPAPASPSGSGVVPAPPVAPPPPGAARNPRALRNSLVATPGAGEGTADGSGWTPGAAERPMPRPSLAGVSPGRIRPGAGGARSASGAGAGAGAVRARAGSAGVLRSSGEGLGGAEGAGQRGSRGSGSVGGEQRGTMDAAAEAQLHSKLAEEVRGRVC